MTKNYNFIISRPPRMTPQSCRTSLQPSKENIQHLKTQNFFIFPSFFGHFRPPGSGYGSAFPMRIRSRIQKTKDHSRSMQIQIHSTAGSATLPTCTVCMMVPKRKLLFRQLEISTSKLLILTWISVFSSDRRANRFRPTERRFTWKEIKTYF